MKAIMMMINKQTNISENKNRKQNDIGNRVRHTLAIGNEKESKCSKHSVLSNSNFN